MPTFELEHRPPAPPTRKAPGPYAGDGPRGPSGTGPDLRIEDHAPVGAGLEGLRRLFLSLLREPDGGSSGRLITNGAVEFGREDQPGFVTEGFAVIRDCLADRLGGGDIEAVALLALYQGILALIRAGYDKAALEAMITQHFETLETRHGR